MVDLYRRLVSWITYTFEQWFWKNAITKQPIDEDEDEILGI